MNTTTRAALLIGSSLLLSACVSQPKPLQGEYSTVTPSVAAEGTAEGTPVRWGGRIVQVEPRSNQTCFEIISTPLTGTGRPSWGEDATLGRFIACRSGFYDPAVFEKNREVTFTGRIDGYETRKIGEYEYRFPRVNADVVYLWPTRDHTNIYVAPPPHPFYAHPYYGPWRHRWWW